VAYAFGGIPLLYMGDELALRNDATYLDDPERAPDNRWMHRPPMDWAAAARRSAAGSLEARVFGGIRRLGEARRSLVSLRGGGESEVLDVGSDAVLCWRRRHPRGGTVVAVANVGERVQAVDADAVTGFGTFREVISSDGPLGVRDGRLVLPGLGFAWFAEP
jgi:amylosucrase